MNNENTKLIGIDGSPTTTSEYQNILIRNYDSTEFSNVHNNSPLNDLTEEYVLFASDVMDYIDKDNYLVTTSKSMSPRAKTSAEPQLSIAPSVSRKDDAGQQFLQTFEDPESTQGSSEMNEIELVLLPSSQEEKIKIEPTYKPLPSSAPRLQSAESVVRTQLPNAIQNRVTKNAPPAAVMNNVSVNSPSMRNQPVILTTTKKLMSEVTQTTAKVSIGNTTISVPLLKPINSSQIQTSSLFSEAQKAQQPMTKLQKSPQQKQQLNIKKILNVKRPGPKANQPTIVSLSQLQVKPMSTAKIVQAKVVGKKMQIQLPNNSTVTSPSPSTSASGLVTITASRPKPNILQNVSFIKSPTKKDVMPNVPDESVGNVTAVSSNVPDQIMNSTDNVTPATTITSAKIKNIKDSQAEHKTALPPVKKTDVTAVPSSNTSSLRNLKATTSLNPTCTSTVKKILASASMHNNPPLLMPLCKPTENHQVQALVNAKRSAIGSTVSIIKQSPNSQLITISGGSNNAASVSVSSSDLRPQQTSTDSLSLKSQPVMLGSSENISKIPGTSLISMPRNISVLLTKSDSNQQIKTSFVNTSASSVTTHSASQTEQLSKKLNLCRSGSLNITTVTLPQSLAGTISPIVTSKATETMTMKAPIVSLAVPVSQSIVQTVESNAGSISVAPKQIKVPSSTASLSLFGVPSVKRPRMSEAEVDSEEMLQAAQSQAKRSNLDVINTKGLEANACESTPEANNRIVKDATLSNEKSAEVKHQIMPQPSLTMRQEDTHNVLLKQLLQNTSNSVTVAKSPSPPVCSQVLSARKVINVRAPSLGLVSSLEAQLARPVLPPVPTATTSQIAVDTSSSPKNSVSKNTNVEADKQSASDTKQKAAVQIISKETSFVSSPSLGINKLQTMPNGVPVRSHVQEQSTATATPTTGLKNTIMNAGRSSEVPTNANQSSGNVQNENFGIMLERNTANVTAEPPDDKLDPSKMLPSENVIQKNHSQQSSTVVLTTSSLGQGTPSNTLSNIFVQQRKVMPEAATAETLLMEKNCMQKISNKVSAEAPSTSTEIINSQTIKEKTAVQKADLSEMQINNSISTTNKAQQDTYGQTAMPIPAQNSSAEMLPKPSTSDNNTFTNATNPKAVLAKDATKDAEMRKKRKRDYQKHRRQFLNSNKDATPNAAAGTSPSITGAPASKKRPRKLLKVEEDYDNFNENLMSHIRQMQPLQVLEPILSRNYSACKMYGKARVSKDAAASSSNDDDLMGEFGCAKLTQVDGLYEKDHINSSAEKDDRNKALSIQNDFYDQEFVPIMSGSEQEKSLRLIGTIRERQVEPLELVCNKNSNNFTSTTDSQQLSKLNTFACLSYPGLILRHSGSSQCFGRMSPVIPFVEPCVQSSPNLPLNFLIEEDNKIASDEKPTMNILKIKRESLEETANSQSVVLTLSPSAVNNVLGVLKDLANLLNIATPTNFKIIDPIDNTQDDKTKHKMPSVFKKATLMQILNGRCKICAKCGRTIESDGIRCSKKAFENCIVTTIAMPTSECSIYFCSRACYTNAKNGTDIALLDQQSKTMNANQTQSRLYPPIKNETTTTIQQSNKVTKKRRFKYFTSKCFTPTPHIKHPSEKELVDILFKMDVTVSANTVIKSLSGTPVIRQIEDARQCILCRQQGDGVPDGPSRLLNFDIDKYVHLNCALWSNGVYETISGGLMNLTSAVQASLNQSCSACQQIGATVKCFKNRCGAVFHLPCALKKGCVFYKNKTIHCQQHAVKTEKENELTTLSVYRRVFIERDENRQVAAVMHHSELSNLLRVGSLTFLNVGQLLPHQLEAFHNNNYIYPIGYKITRFYWSMKRPNKRCRYICSIIDVAGKPEFRIQVQETNENDVELQDTTPSGVWQKVLESIATMRKKHDLVQLFPRHISGEDLFGLTEPAIVRIIESLPGVESLTDYRFKYGRNPLLELPLAINPSGAARTEPKQRQIMGWRKPHTQRTGTFSNHQRVANSVTSVVAGEVTCPYSKQFVHSKSSQYKKMKQEWRNNVYLARSKIQGLGLYAARDMERHTMIIEYIGEVIRTEVSEIREKQYESRNRGIYMFRLDEERVVDATLSGGLARYINHSCNPNCVTEIVEVDRELRIIIFAKRRINRGEELSYDYKFDIEDDAHKIQCMCGAPNCRKWMN